MRGARLRGGGEADGAREQRANGRGDEHERQLIARAHHRRATGPAVGSGWVGGFQSDLVSRPRGVGTIRRGGVERHASEGGRRDQQVALHAG